MPARLKAHWPPIVAVLLFLAAVAVIQPWSELPLNDDWQYAHAAKALAEHGSFPTDIAVAPTLVGQSVMAWPVIQVFGFSHVALRALTMILSVLMLFELDYLLVIGGVSARVRVVTLCAVVGNPLFLHLSTTFMTENYGYFVALLSACIWFHGREKNRGLTRLAAAILAALSFWIRQFCAIVFPALLLAEWIAGDASIRNARPVLTRNAGAVVIYAAIVAAYFPWAIMTGHFVPQFSTHLSQAVSPSFVPIVFQSGVFLFYMTFFLAPFVLSYGIPARPSIAGSFALGALTVTALLAFTGGAVNGPPSATLNSTFPFLNNVFTTSGVGPITLSDVYWENTPARPRTPELVWLILEVITLVVSLAWGGFITRLKAEKNPVALFGVSLALLSLGATVLSYRDDVFDRYHYVGVIGFTLALALCLPRGRERRLVGLAAGWFGALALYSTISLHDYFRWNEARWSLLSRAQHKNISLADIDAGFEPNGWNAVENEVAAVDCPLLWCRGRRYYIGLAKKPSDSLILFQRSHSWLRFPDVELLERR